MVKAWLGFSWLISFIFFQNNIRKNSFSEALILLYLYKDFDALKILEHMM